MTRDELASMLEQEGFPTAANRILGGGDPSRVLGELRPFVPLHYKRHKPAEDQSVSLYLPRRTGGALT